ncbi:phage holin family protein [Clostridium sp. ZS2-4]|nr:phage holin family protein [Clostridium sp. ZS2-4]
MKIMDFVVKQALILISALYVTGLMLKHSKVKDWLIPWILLIGGMGRAVALMGLNANVIIQGSLVTGATVYTNQLLKQTTEKNKEQQ